MNYPKLTKFILFLIFPIISHSFDHDHKLLTQVLSQTVVEKSYSSKVDYDSLKNSPILLNKYLKQISAVSKNEFDSFKKRQRLSFLINAYNAFTLKLIIDHYPVESIKDIGGFFSSPWSKEFFTLFGEKTDLDSIEHKMIRKWFDEPRIHFAVNCASIGCPALRKKAFTATNLELLLEESSILFLKDKTRNRLNGKKLEVSKIFKWYGDDFNKKYKSFKHFILQKLSSSLKPEEVSIEFLEYDWKLNKI